MPVYEYKALDKKGKPLKGILDADSEAVVRSRLRAAGNYPVEIKKSRQGVRTAGKATPSFLSQRVRQQEIAAFTRQLATLLGAGIPLVSALAGLVEQTGNTTFKKNIAHIKDFVNEGGSLTNALSLYPQLFSSIYTNMVRAGEASGTLDVVLERLADVAEEQGALRGRLKAALVYPLFMAIIGVGILVVLITYIVPNITQVFVDMKQALPWPTLFLIWLSDVVKSYWWLLLLLAMALVVAFRAALATEQGSRLWDLLRLKAPLIGPVSRKIILARFASTLSSLLGSGVDLITSLQIARSLLNNIHFVEVVDEAIEQINKGRSMTGALSPSPWFPPMFVQMLGVGEQSGELEGMLAKVSTAYEREVESAILAMTALLEPLLIVAMGAAVGFIVLSILLPIFAMNQMVG